LPTRQLDAARLKKLGWRVNCRAGGHKMMTQIIL
jgi:hypothetical protein